MHWLSIDLDWAYSHLLAMIYRQTRCKSSAYDVLHDAFLSYVLLPNREDILQPHAYLRTIVKTTISDDRRRASRFLPLVADENESYCQGLEHLWPDSFEPSSEHLADLQQRLQAMYEIINALPAKCRQVFWLYRVKGFSQPEIAQQMNISLKMVEGHMARAMLTLKSCYDSILD